VARVLAPTEKVRQPRTPLPQLRLFDPEARLKAWVAQAEGTPAVRCGVVHPCHAGVLEGALRAAHAGLIVPQLIGPIERIRATAEQAGLDLHGIDVIDAPHSDAAAGVAARLAADGYAWAMVCALLGFGHRHLNRHWRWLPWAREAVFPWYVLHQTLIIAALAWLGPWRLGGWREPWLVLALTVGGCALLTEGLIRHHAWLRPWFGLPSGRRMESRIKPKSS